MADETPKISEPTPEVPTESGVASVAEKPVTEKRRKPFGRLFGYIGSRSKKMKILMGVAAVVVVLAAGAGGYFLWGQPQTATTVETDHGYPVTYVNGKRVVQVYKSLPVAPTPSPEQIKAGNQKAIAAYEAKIASGKAVSDDYFKLGQLYLVSGDKAKLIINYQKALDTADPNMANYQSYIDMLKKTITDAKASK